MLNQIRFLIGAVGGGLMFGSIAGGGIGLLFWLGVGIQFVGIYLKFRFEKPQ